MVFIVKIEETDNTERRDSRQTKETGRQEERLSLPGDHDPDPDFWWQY